MIPLTYLADPKRVMLQQLMLSDYDADNNGVATEHERSARFQNVPRSYGDGIGIEAVCNDGFSSRSGVIVTGNGFGCSEDGQADALVDKA